MILEIMNIFISVLKLDNTNSFVSKKNNWYWLVLIGMHN
jgi:hypothetical protein